MKKLYPGFPYPAHQIKKYFHNLNYFVLKMTSGELVSFTAPDEVAFLAWLRQHRVVDIREEDDIFDL